MITRRECVVAGVMLGLVAGAYGSEQVAGNPLFSVAADQSLDTSDFSVMVDSNVADGSGALFAMGMGTKNGVNVINLGVATADRVMNGANRWTVSIPDGSSMFSFNSQVLAETYTARGPGTYALPEDLGYIGITVAQNQVNANTWAFLQTLTDVNGILGTASATPGLVIHNYGYGRSAQYLLDDGTTVATNPAAGRTVVGYEWNNTLPVQDSYGVGRVTNQKSLGIQRVNGNITGLVYNYDYDGLTWTLPANNPGKLGQTSRNDWGGAIMSFTGALVGINTLSMVSNGSATKQDFLYGANYTSVAGAPQNFSGAGIGFTQADVNFLNNQFTTTSAPEPSTIAAFALFGAGILARRRK